MARVRVNIGFDDGFRGRGAVAKKITALAGLNDGIIKEVGSRRDYAVLQASSEIAELLMIFAARSLNVNNVILPALEAGTWVVSDRFTDSSRAYQGGGRGIPLETIDRLADWVHGDVWPDLTILLDAPVEIGMERAKSRSTPDRFEQERHDFFQRVRECYLGIASREPTRFVVIDTMQSLDEVKFEVRALADQLLGDV